MENADTNQQSPVIDMRGVDIGSVAETDITVLEHMDWTVNAGEFWVIAGMHGSGKSDLMATAAGLVGPAKGMYQFFGHDMPITDEDRMADRLRMGMVFEGGQLLHHLTVESNVALPLRYHRPEASTDEIKAMLELTELVPWSNSTPGAMSRSWQKRAGLARALILKPEVLLLDDPLGGLDPRHVIWWVDLLGQLSAGHPILGGRRLTIIVTTEDLRPWRKIGGHFVILQDKQFIPLGHCPDLSADPHPLVKEFLSEHSFVN